MEKEGFEDSCHDSQKDEAFVEACVLERESFEDSQLHGSFMFFSNKPLKDKHFSYCGLLVGISCSLISRY
jgi:hypothetical protein